MKKYLIIVSLFLSLVYSSLAEKKVSEQTAVKYINGIKDGNTQVIESLQDSTMNQMFSGKNLTDFLEKLKSQVGAIKTIAPAELVSSKVHDTYIIPVTFEAATLDAKIVVNSGINKITGFFIVPHEQKVNYKYPEYADTSKFYEKNCRVGEEDWELPAILTLPKLKSNAPVPVVVLVHGSGPHDKDETIGPNKVFKDIAAGLASKGIAVLRYEKRTKYYGSKIAADYSKFTIYEETVNDAVEAVKYLTIRPEIDKKKIFVLGHSLGGLMAPKIGNLSKDVAGIILMAGSNRPLYELLLEQMDYLMNIDGEVSKEEKEALDIERRLVDNLLKKDLKDDYPADSLPLSLPAKYWKSLLAYDPIAEIKKFDKKIFVMQGDRDYQVTLKDYDNWHQALEKNDKASFKVFNRLNHLFMNGKGPANPQEYDIENHVDKGVIDEVISFIKY